MANVHVLSLSFLTAFSSVAHAQLADEYLRRLSLVEAVAHARKPHVEASPSADGVPARLTVLATAAKYYWTGQHWVVEFTPNDLRAIRAPASVGDDKSAQPGRLERQEPQKFSFDVLEAVPGSRARLEVREVATPPVAAPAVDHLLLEVGGDFRLISKEIHYRDGRPARLILLNAKGNVPLGFDPFPVDLPDHGFPERDSFDFLGRPIRAIWREGRVWPEYFESTAGTAVVVDTATLNGRSAQ